MKKTNYIKKAVITLLLLLCLILLLHIFGLLKAGFTKNTFKARFKENWGITLPNHFELLFTETEPSFHGDGYRCYILQLNSEEEQVQTFLSHFHSFRNTDAEDFYLQAVRALTIPEDYQLSFNYEYLWALTEEDTSKMLMLYDTHTQQLYLIGYCS